MAELSNKPDETSGAVLEDRPTRERGARVCGNHATGGRFASTSIGANTTMPKTSKTIATVDEIAERAARGEDVSASFTNKFTVVRLVRRVNVDLTRTLLGRALNEEQSIKQGPKRKAG